jgi:hypothetical protein
MRYLSITRGSEESNPNQESAGAVPPPAALMEAIGQLIEKYMKEGVLIDTGGLAPSQQGFRVRLAQGKIATTDGPFSESKEVIGGWAIFEADSKAEAQRLTTEFLDLHRKLWPESKGEFETEVRLIVYQAKP